MHSSPAIEFRARQPGAHTKFRLRHLALEFGRYSYSFNSEAKLYSGLEQAMAAAGYTWERQKTFGTERPDYFLDGLAIEVKVDGSFPQALRQVHRYAGHDEIRAVLLLTTKRWPEGEFEACGKKVLVSRLRRTAF